VVVQLKSRRFNSRRFKSREIILSAVALGWTFSCFAQQSAPPRVQPYSPPSSGGGISGNAPSGSIVPGSIAPGNISGTIVDQSGAVVVGAQIQLNTPPNVQLPAKDQAPNQKVLSGDDGKFSFSNVSPGPFQLTVISLGFSPQTISGTLRPGEDDLVPQIVMAVASNITEVEVGLSREDVAEIADAQLKVEEHQRVLGAIPNFYVSYIPNAAPLTSHQKFKLAFKTVIDPFTLVMVAGTAGVEQAQNHFIGYGQGTEGYAKRFGAGYADTISGTFIGGAILPSLLKQDPRYFYKGTGSVGFRFLYAIANSVICKGDNRKWQFNYSGILGSLAAGGISNIYYPAQDRNGLGLTFANAAIGIASTAASNVLQEFLIKKLTPHTVRPDTVQPDTARPSAVQPGMIQPSTIQP
jgi:hypothetical protein